MIVTKRGMGCGGRDSVGAQLQSQGEMNLVSGVRRADERRCFVRQKRVVLTASGLASSPAEAKPAQPGRPSHQFAGRR